MQIGAIDERDMQNLLTGVAVLAELAAVAAAEDRPLDLPYRSGRLTIPADEIETFRLGLRVTTNKLVALLGE